MIDYYDIIVEENELLYGPGKRLVLWVQGCSIRCKGCTNQHLWSREGAKKISSKDLIVLISGYPDLEGITLLGGEPADQLDELIPVMKWSKHNNLSVILFTGYEIEDFLQPNEIEFITYTDLVICGPFQLDKRNPYLHFRGSTNQRIIRTSQRYHEYKIFDGCNIILLNVNNDGKIINKGFTNDEIIAMINDYAD